MKNVFKVLMYFCFAIGFLYSAVFFYNEMRVVSTTAVFGVVLNIVCGIAFIVEVVFEFSKRRDKKYDNGKLSMDKKIFSNIMVVIYLFLIIVAFVTVSAHIYYMDMNNIMDVCFGVISFILAGVCGIAVLLLEVSGKNK
ncbi:MAG: hypothetical protein KIC55_04335 [Lachnoanaerobaculum sp.]|uniref:hypothetical protein n=1 Tax=Lachnoanaerobaculum sp. TaxID=2049030 RepID=UPI0025BDC031|nr:hypothetical protein [Lachnoanaerobaculum sp.]MBS5881621.1 hypothetical protein [Lachnoanaerobaculum sp.]